MPSAAPRPCTYPGCGVLVHGGSRCDRHQVEVKRQAEDRRASSSERGYGYKWQKAREGFLKRHPLCASCEAAGRVAAATVVDHIMPHKGDQSLFWDRGNWQPLCKPCHDAKTAREDGGYGNRGGG